MVSMPKQISPVGRPIVRYLDRLVELIEQRREAISAVEADVQTLLSKAFGRITAGAPLRPMAKVAPLVRRLVAAINPDRIYAELGVRSFGRSTFHKSAIQGSDITWQQLFRVEQGDLVFSNIKAWEGAFAVATRDDHGRSGSHRDFTCVPVPGTMTAHYLWYYLQTRNSLDKVQQASPGSADRNRTLGQARLAAIDVPVPPIKAQHWFDRLLSKARQARRIGNGSTPEVDALLSAILREVFGTGYVQAN